MNISVLMDDTNVLTAATGLCFLAAAAVNHIYPKMTAEDKNSSTAMQVINSLPQTKSDVTLHSKIGGAYNQLNRIKTAAVKKEHSNAEIQLYKRSSLPVNSLDSHKEVSWSPSSPSSPRKVAVSTPRLNTSWPWLTSPQNGAVNRAKKKTCKTQTQTQTQVCRRSEQIIKKIHYVSPYSIKQIGLDSYLPQPASHEQ